MALGDECHSAAALSRRNRVFVSPQECAFTAGACCSIPTVTGVGGMCESSNHQVIDLQIVIVWLSAYGGESKSEKLSSRCDCERRILRLIDYAMRR